MVHSRLQTLKYSLVIRFKSIEKFILTPWIFSKRKWRTVLNEDWQQARVGVDWTTDTGGLRESDREARERIQEEIYEETTYSRAARRNTLPEPAFSWITRFVTYKKKNHTQTHTQFITSRAEKETKSRGLNWTKTWLGHSGREEKKKKSLKPTKKEKPCLVCRRNPRRMYLETPCLPPQFSCTCSEKANPKMTPTSLPQDTSASSNSTCPEYAAFVVFLSLSAFPRSLLKLKMFRKKAHERFLFTRMYKEF